MIVKSGLVKLFCKYKRFPDESTWLMIGLLHEKLWQKFKAVSIEMLIRSMFSY